MSTILKALERVEEERRVHDAGGPAPATADGGSAPSDGERGFGESVARPGEPFAHSDRGESSGWNPIWVVALGIVLTLGMSWYALRDGETETTPTVAQGTNASAPNSGSQVGPLAAVPPSDRLPASMEVERSPLEDAAAALAARAQNETPPNVSGTVAEPRSEGPVANNPQPRPSPISQPSSGSALTPTAADALPAARTRPARGFPRSRPSNAPGMERARELAAAAPPAAPPSREDVSPARLAARDLWPRDNVPVPAALPSGEASSESSLPNIATRPPSSAPAEELAVAPTPPAAVAKPAPAKAKRRTAALPRAPKVTIERTVWHPTADRRSARVLVDGMKGPLELKEGDAVGVLVVSEINPSSVVFLHGANRIKRSVGR